ncbi:MAG: zinc ribbon domain-containing protein [Clostridia bacterium]|nr:zinc ribbon domain-containing protein [Clostridia bacterium]MBR2176351.1 zinc ribbon domain-containing protein [Clostridia bacterium]
MSANTIGLIIAGLLFALPVAVILVIIIRIRIMIRQFEKESGKKIRAKDFIRDMKSTDATVKSAAPLNGMDRIYLPQIHRDFPDFQLTPLIPQIETFIKTYLNAIESKDTKSLDKLSIAPSLIDRADEIITDLRSRDISVFYDNIVVHRTVISEYVKENGMTIIRFQSAVGYLNYTVNSKGKLISGSRDVAEETVFVTSYARVLDSELARQAGVIDVIGLNCPNCGAPLRSSSVSFCEFCGTGMKNLPDDVFGWTFTDIKEKNRMTKKLF